MHYVFLFYFVFFSWKTSNRFAFSKAIFVNKGMWRNLPTWAPAFLKICFAMWSSLICIVDRGVRQIGDQIFSLSYVFTVLEQCWNSDLLPIKDTHVFWLLFLLRKSKLYEGRDNTLILFTFSISFLSWFRFSSRDVFVLFVSLSVCGSAYWSRLLLKFVLSLVILSVDEQCILQLRYAFSFRIFHDIFKRFSSEKWFVIC